MAFVVPLIMAGVSSAATALSVVKTNQKISEKKKQNSEGGNGGNVPLLTTLKGNAIHTTGPLDDFTFINETKFYIDGKITNYSSLYQYKYKVDNGDFINIVFSNGNFGIKRKMPNTVTSGNGSLFGVTGNVDGTFSINLGTEDIAESTKTVIFKAILITDATKTFTTNSFSVHMPKVFGATYQITPPINNSVDANVTVTSFDSQNYSYSYIIDYDNPVTLPTSTFTLSNLGLNNDIEVEIRCVKKTDNNVYSVVDLLFSTLVLN